ncbi:cytochrome ubiquinol oxidase subunit I, partial [Streptomyces sp. JV178]
WGFGRSLEWATSCPPPRHNFVTLPRVRSESPAFDLHHPRFAAITPPQTREGQERTPHPRFGQERPSDGREGS